MDILTAIEHCGYTITPSQASSLCSIPLAKAESELCGISAIIPGATFTMEPTAANDATSAKDATSANDAATPTFKFPLTFRSSLSSTTIRSDLHDAVSSILPPTLSLLRLLFGLCLIISLLLVILFLLLALFFALKSNLRVPRNLRSNLRSLHSLSFLYYILGGSNPFFSSLGTSSFYCLALLDPRVLLNPFFHLRARSMSRRSYALPTLASSSSLVTSLNPLRFEPQVLDGGAPLAMKCIDEFVFGPQSPQLPSDSGMLSLAGRFVQANGLRATEAELSMWPRKRTG